MPPEPLPWDRKDFFREKKHSNGGYDRVSEPLGGSAARWRDAPSHGSRNDFGRWGGFSSDFRRPPGHGKQGGWHLYPDDFSHGYATARSGDRFFQDGGGFRPSGPYRDGRYNRNFRESRASINQREWRGHSWDYSHHNGAPPSGPSRLYDGKDQKSVDGAPARLSRPQVDVANTSNVVRSEEKRDESSDVNKAGTCQGVEKEESLASDWKTFKWSRPVSLTSRGSGLTVSSSSKGAGEPGDTKIDLPLKIATPDESSSGDAAGCLASPTSLEDASSRKKQRLGWGEGLAKYEKKRVDGPDDSQIKSPSTPSTTNIESMHSPSQNWVEKSPRIGSIFECISPTTPSSVAYSSSPGLNDKCYMKASEIESDANKLSLSPTPRAQNHFIGVSLNLENVDSNSFFNLNGLLTELLEKEEHSSVDSGLTKAALDKLLSLKGGISKVLEMTESEIDSLENELKSLKSLPGSNSQVPKLPSSISMGCEEKANAELNAQSSHSLPAISSGDLTVGGMLTYDNVVEHALGKTKDECCDSHGTATSNCTEILSPDKLSSQQCHSMGAIFLESANYEACTSVLSTAGSSSPDSETKVAKNSDAARHENVAVCDNLEDNALTHILDSNKQTAIEASKLLGNLLPSSSCDVVESIEANSSTFSQNNLLAEMFAKRNRSVRFKERVLLMKYKVFRCMWQEDLQLLAERKHRTKCQKKVESGSRSLHTGPQKHRASLRFISPASNMSLSPSSEVVSFTKKLLSDPQIRCYRNDLKMPALMLDQKEKMLSRFLSNNGLVQDPCAVERERALINPWTAEEKKIFLDKYAAFGKDFTKISSFLDCKSTADCIEFYYKNHKSDIFKKAKKQQVLKKKETSAPTIRYLMTTEKRSKEMNAASLDMLGAASAIVAHGDNEGMKSAKILSISGSDRKLRRTGGLREMSSSYNIEDERETEAADVLAGICGSLSSEAMSSCITSSADPGDGTQDWKSWKTSSEPSATRCPPTAEVTQNVDDDTCSDESCGYVEPVDWTDEEKSSFVQAFSSYGKDFVMISRCVQTKSRDQCKVFFSKARKCLGLEMLYLRPGDQEMQTADGLDGGQSDTEDACVVEYDLATCGDKSSVGTGDENTAMPTSSLNYDDNAMNLHSTVDLSVACAPVPEDLKGRSHNQDCQLEISPDMPDDGTVLNEDVENVASLQYLDERYAPIAADCREELMTAHSGVMVETVTNAARTETLPSIQHHTFVAEIASEKLEEDFKNTSPDNQDVGTARFGSELKRSASVNDLHKSLHGQTSPDFVKSCTPKLAMQLEKSRGVSSHLLPSTHPCLPETETSTPMMQVYLKKCQRSASVIQAIGELPVLSKNESQMNESGLHHQRPLPDAASDQSCKNVKLFGQILSKSSTEDKPTSEISTIRSSSCEGSGNLNLLPVKQEMDKYTLTNGPSGLQSFPARKSYGFLDANRLQTGCSSIPDSTLLVPRYPTIFENPSLSTSTSERKLPVLANVATSNSNLGFCPGGQDKIQPYRLEMKQLSEVPRNGFEAVPGLKQIEMNVVHSDARSVGSCNGLTDPVAALQLHYAKTHQQNRGGDVGR